jgi:predicted DNA-binding protein (MmcQ/YjbR family)
MRNIDRLEAMSARLPESERVDVIEWGGQPTFRVRGKNFLFSDPEGTHITVKLGVEEAAVVVAADPAAVPAGYGLGRHGWVAVNLPKRPSAARWQEVEEWLRTSYTLVAPKQLAARVLDEGTGARR